MNSPLYPQLRDDTGDPDVYAIVEEFFPYDGPYSGWVTGYASALIGRLSRYLGNATGKRSALPDAPTVGRVLYGLNEASYSLAQTIFQLSEFAAGLADDPSLYDDRGAAAPGTAYELAAALDDVHDAMGAVQSALQRAAGVASHLGHDTGEES